MKSLLIVAHGSRRQASNDEVRMLTARIAKKIGKDFEYIQSAFLELAEPSIPEGLEQCIKKGASEIIVLPYFLSAGRHVAEDIPGEVATVSDKYPEVEIKIVPYLGAMDRIVDLMIEQATSDFDRTR